MPNPQGYSRTQITLHWVVFALVVAQFVFKDSIAQAWDQFSDGITPAFSLMVAAHVAGGGAVLLLTLWRLGLRRTRGVPAAPKTDSAPQRMAAHLVHITLYALLILMPISGAVAWFGGVGTAADGHGVLKFALLAVVGLHVVAALWHQYGLRDGLLKRMMRAG